MQMFNNIWIKNKVFFCRNIWHCGFLYLYFCWIKNGSSMLLTAGCCRKLFRCLVFSERENNYTPGFSWIGRLLPSFFLLYLVIAIFRYYNDFDFNQFGLVVSYDITYSDKYSAETNAIREWRLDSHQCDYLFADLFATC